jgi:5-formyltetrahydrofolate cyclo-ligase
VYYVNKKELRKHLVYKRKQKSKSFVMKNSKYISENLRHISSFNGASHILFYVSTNGEVHTHDLIKESLSLNKNVYVPISETKTHTLTISKIKKFSDLKPSTYSILEPKKEKISAVPLHEIEVIIVPGVGFDKQGHRIGQGGGYYDWLLSHTKAISIALAFEFQIQHTLPTDPHDQKVDFIVTEKRIISCNIH